MRLSELDPNKIKLVGHIDIPTFQQPQLEKRSFGKKLGDFGRGLGDILGGSKIGEFIGSKIAERTPAAKQLKQDPLIQTQMEKTGKPLFETPNAKQLTGDVLKIGTTIGSALLPGSGSFIGKVAQGASLGYAMDVSNKLTEDKQKVFTPGLGTAIGTALPVAGVGFNLGKKLVGRLFKGLGSGLSGVSSETIDKIVSNPKIAIQATQKLAKTGNNKVLEENAKQIITGVSKIRQEARFAYRQEIEQLAKEDINSAKFRSHVQQFLDNVGSVFNQKTGQRSLGNVEFSDPANLKRASKLIDSLSKTDLDGKSLAQLINRLENSQYKIATSDERLAYNAFVRDLTKSVKDAVIGSTNKLGEMNARYSADMQLAEAVQNIFGKVEFKNLPEVLKASQKLESLFSQKGLAPQVVDDFLNRIGINPAEFKTAEAVRQISNKQTPANVKGLTIGELTQQVTSSVLTPQMIKNISIGTGLFENEVIPYLKKLKPSAQNIFIRALFSTDEEK